jgi:hypothetical protein
MRIHELLRLLRHAPCRLRIGVINAIAAIAAIEAIEAIETLGRRGS